MDAGQIDLILRDELKSTPTRFLGVFAADRIPTTGILSYPACLVANTDPYDKPGSHWVAYYLASADQVEFFDSYGLPPSAYSLPLTASSYNTHDFQSLVSDVCGQYCIYYLTERSHHHSLPALCAHLAKYGRLTDQYVRLFVKRKCYSLLFGRASLHPSGQSCLSRNKK